MNGILKLGYSKPLDHDDLWDIADRDAASKLSADFHVALASGKTKGSVVRAAWQQFGGAFLRAGLVKLVHDIAVFTGEKNITVLSQHMLSYHTSAYIFLAQAEAPKSGDPTLKP